MSIDHGRSAATIYPLSDNPTLGEIDTYLNDIPNANRSYAESAEQCDALAKRYERDGREMSAGKCRGEARIFRQWIEQNNERAAQLRIERANLKRRIHMTSPLDFRICEARRCRQSRIDELSKLRKVFEGRHRECPECQASFCLVPVSKYDFAEERRDILNEINYYTRRILKAQAERNYIARFVRETVG